MLSDDDDCFIGRSPSPPAELTTANVLEEFREKWKQQILSGNEILNENEIDSSGGGGSVDGGTGGGTSSSIANNDVDDDNTKAKQYFQKASELENLGKVFEAMHLYRRAVQICPDIEFKMYEITKTNNKNDENDNKKKLNNKINDNLNGNIDKNIIDTRVRNEGDDDDDDDDEDDDDDDNLDGVDLLARFQIAISRTGRLFQRANQFSSSSGDTIHLSNLPMEIILYILKWVVSNDLDLRSLEQLSLVSKGFYICAKDQEIWRLACHKIWGVHVGTLKSTTYLTWREMYLDRHRVHFNGCYISKTSYLRYGEHNFQDQFYRPIHLIEYYRYIRFFPDGNALMMTTPDEPSQIVPKLKTQSITIPRSEVLKGNYRLHGDTIALCMKRTIGKSSQLNNNRQYRRNLVDRNNDDGAGDGNFEKNHTFLLEFQIGTAAKRKFNQLKWKNYSMIQITKKNEEISTDFELKPSMYPSFIFSRVKSYNSVSEMPLI